jgi:hypothetical protein
MDNIMLLIILFIIGYTMSTYVKIKQNVSFTPMSSMHVEQFRVGIK